MTGSADKIFRPAVDPVIVHLMRDADGPALHIHIRPCQPADLAHPAGSPYHDLEHGQMDFHAWTTAHIIKKNLLIW